MRHFLRPERIAVRRSMLIEGAAEHGEELLEAIAERLEASQIEDGRWSVRPVTYGSWTASAEPWLVVEHRRLADVRHYVRCRGCGAHLDLIHVTAIEPAWWKRLFASVVHGRAWWRYSVPGPGQAEEELRSWLAVVNRAVTAAAQQLAQRLARRHVLGERAGNVLAWW